MTTKQAKYPGIAEVLNGNGAVAYVMKHVCGGVIGYPITPSTEISENFEAARAEGQLNVWGKHPFFVETEGEHSAQSGALGAALTGGNYISNASSSQGILYALESHYTTVGKKIGGFVLQVAARVVTRHSLNVMAGHDDVYSLLPAGYTILFGSSPQEAADLAAISYRCSALSLIPVANSMDGFATSHVMSELLLPEPELLAEYLGDPASRIPCPTVAQEILFGAKGRSWQLQQWLKRHAEHFNPDKLKSLRAQLESDAAKVETDTAGKLIQKTLTLVPSELHGKWRRAWLNAHEKGTRALVPALVDPNNPGLTGPVQNQPDFQAGAVDHRTHFASAVPGIVREAMSEYSKLTGREYTPIHCYDTADADYIMVGLGSITDDARAVLPYLRSQGLKVGVVSVKLLQPFPEAELVAALKGAKAVTVLERSELCNLTTFVTEALFKARANAENSGSYPGIPTLDATPKLTCAIFGLGGHDVQPRDLIAAFRNMADPDKRAGLVYLGSTFFDPAATGTLKALQERLREAYPETELMALETEPNPQLLPEQALRIRFHSIGGYGMVSTGKLLTDILSGMSGMYSKSAPKYGSEKSGAPTQYYITLSPEPVLLTNAELEDVDIVVASDHQVFSHTNPLKGLVKGGTFILQSDKDPLAVWARLPKKVRTTIREKELNFKVIDAFAVAVKHAPNPQLEVRMMGIAFIGAVIGNVQQIATEGGQGKTLELIKAELQKKFGSKGSGIVTSNMAVISDAITAVKNVDYAGAEFVKVDSLPAKQAKRSIELSASVCPFAKVERSTGLFDPAYYEDLMARPFREGTIGNAPVLPGAGLFIAAGSGAFKDKGIFRRTAPVFNPAACTGCMECAIACPDSAIPNTIHEISDLLGAAIAQVGVQDALTEVVPAWAAAIREVLLADAQDRAFDQVAAQAITGNSTLSKNTALKRHKNALIAALETFPVARTRPFFTAAEKAESGTGGMFSAVVDPWKCTGCLQCVQVCGPKALTSADQDDALLETLEERFEVFTKLPNTAERYAQEAIAEGGDLKRLLLDHNNYFSIVGGHGACRGCGEVTITHLVAAMSRAKGEAKRRAHIAELEQLLADLAAKSKTADAPGAARIKELTSTLESRLYLYEGGPTGFGPAPMVVTNSTGCSSVYSSTMPATQFIDPWVNSLFHDAQPLAAGIYEGFVSAYVDEVKAIRAAKAELTNTDPGVLDTLSWRGFSAAELDLLPVILSISGDGAIFDIGFGAMSRVLAGGTPIKILALDTGGYSNTGGQASTASYTGQDADLARYGKSHPGKAEIRKELGLLAAFHPNTFVCATSSALHGHFLSATADMLNFNDGAALMIAYAPCGTENGMPEDLSTARSRLAVESRLSPIYIHNPNAGQTLPERFSLDGNPAINAAWTTSTIEYRDDAGNLALFETPLTPAVFALGEVRFAKQFKKLSDDVNAVEISEFIELDPSSRASKTPFIWATDSEKKLIKVGCSASIVALVEDRLHNWQTLQYLAGIGQAELASEHAAELAGWKQRYDQATADKDAALDSIADAMVAMVMAKQPVSAAQTLGLDAPAASGAAPAPAAPQAGDERPIWLDPADEPRCVDCGTCYQDLPQLFDKVTIVVNGEAKSVARLKVDALSGLTVTPELTKRFNKVKATCDAEIIK
ncbi:MAG: 2-oxoacid:acceptor oxidoreductase family protein [Propionibacteriaceae bacterium]|nr:2-oxoacid:acceptor oxidoreductase family protein [Propionibacteriaceae bacterium]